MVRHGSDKLKMNSEIKESFGRRGERMGRQKASEERSPFADTKSSTARSWSIYVFCGVIAAATSFIALSRGGDQEAVPNMAVSANVIEQGNSAAIVYYDPPTKSAGYTRGDIKDMNTADQVTVCARGYIGRRQSGDTNTQLWLMCLQAVSGSDHRNPLDVAWIVIKNQGYNVFEIENDPGWLGRNQKSRRMSENLVNRIKSGA
jgi:hypothetical protein